MDIRRYTRNNGQPTAGTRILHRVAVIVVIVVVTVAAGCATTNPYFQALSQFNNTEKERNAEPELRIQTEGKRFILTTPHLPGLTLSGVFSRPAVRRVELFVTEARLFANWANGWTEGVYEASGTLELTERSRDSAIARGELNPTAAPATASTEATGDARFRRFFRYHTVTVAEPIELWTLRHGEIRYYDTYIRGDEGIIKVKARVDRLTALAEWFREEGAPRESPAVPAVLERLAEIYGDYDANDAPDPIAEIYRSGSAARDLREAPTMFTALYNVSYVNNNILDTLVLEER